MILSAMHTLWQRESIERRYRNGDEPFSHGQIGEKWLSTVRKLCIPGSGHLDLGCGDGRMTFALADIWSQGGWSLGGDLDEAALERARARANEERLTGAEFIRMDVEREDYAAHLAGRSPQLVTAHLCMSSEIVKQAARILFVGGVFAGVALHVDLWKEPGCPSRFAMSEKRLEDLLDEHHLTPVFLRLEKEELQFNSARQALEEYFGNGKVIPQRWRNDNRWEAIRQYFSEGGRTLTVRSQVQCIARKSSP